MRVPTLMKTTWKYIGAASLGTLASCLVAGLGFNLATESFYAVGHPPVQTEASRAQGESGAMSPPLHCLGASRTSLSRVRMPTISVSVRPSGWKLQMPSTCAVEAPVRTPVIKVQLEGERLRVASRHGGWVEVVEPETELTGWVYEQYVIPIEPESKQVSLVDAER